MCKKILMLQRYNFFVDFKVKFLFNPVHLENLIKACTEPE